MRLKIYLFIYCLHSIYNNIYITINRQIQMELTKNVSNQNTETKITAHKPTHRHTQLIFPYITYTRARAHTHCARTHTHTRAGNTHVRICRGTHEQDAHAHTHTHTHPCRRKPSCGPCRIFTELRGQLKQIFYFHSFHLPVYF